MEEAKAHSGQLLLSASYLAPIDYYVLLNRYASVYIDSHEHYVKQSYRNRCSIFGANGKQDLILPVKHTGKKMLMKDVRIDNDCRWQKIHWRSLVTAYSSSPYFEYYEDVIAPFYHQKQDSLLDFNLSLQEAILKTLKMSVTSFTTNSYSETYEDRDDYRNNISPKTPQLFTHLPTYMQVFGDKHGFIPNLSIVDLLFNLGTDAKDYLQSEI